MIASLNKTRIPGCIELHLRCHSDERGRFLKTFQRDEFAQLGLDVDFVETFATTSSTGVLRGMHLQLPPADHSKLVYCLAGRAQDIVLDLRKGSPMYGQHEVIDLSADNGNAVFIPKGVAHGFCVIEAPTVMMYHVTAQHVPHLDSGVRWDSFGAEWAVSTPVISRRDAALPSVSRFDSPFAFTHYVQGGQSNG